MAAKSGRRFGILADIHGNVWALEAVLEDTQRRGIEQFINLGDALYGPLKPRATFELLQTIDAVTIQGNQERDIYEPTPDQISANPRLAYVVADLGPEPIGWIKSLPKTALVSNEIFACHGTPQSDMVYLLEDVTRGFPVIKTEQAILDELQGISYPVILCAHTHIPRVVQLSTGTVIVNPGSVGLPAYDQNTPNYHTMQTYAPFASYALIEKRASGWQVEQIQVPYNYAAAAEQARRQGRSDCADWIATGRVNPSQ